MGHSVNLCDQHIALFYSGHKPKAYNDARRYRSGVRVFRKIIKYPYRPTSYKQFYDYYYKMYINFIVMRLAALRNGRALVCEPRVSLSVH